jgi:hypothetical protein
VNGDGFDDVLIGAFGNDAGGRYAGAAYLVLGSATPGDLPLFAADAAYTGEAGNDLAGGAVSVAGDVDGDGFDDLLVGAYGYSGGSNAGAAYLVLGSPTPADLSLSAADARYTGEAADDYAGHSVSGARDVDGDGFDDLLVGAHYDDAGGTKAGAAYLLVGPGF